MFICFLMRYLLFQTLGLVLRSPKRFIDRELGALAVNLSTDSNSASLLVSDREVLHQVCPSMPASASPYRPRPSADGEARSPHQRPAADEAVAQPLRTSGKT